MSKAVPDSVTRLIEAFSRLPGIGPKTANRLAYFLLRAPDDLSVSLSEAIAELKAKTRLCSICFNITEQDPCGICEDNNRDGSLIAIVEEPLDVLALERTGVFKGRYHVLHGVLSPREGIGPDDLKIHELSKRVEQGGIRELILGTNPGMQGDSTALYIKQTIGEHFPNVKLSRLARGLATGADLEYADSITIMRALEGRQAL
jgi:recombination protein RecR